MVENASTHGPTFFFGFMAVGEEASMQKLENAARQTGFPAERATNDNNETEVMVLFPPGSDSRKALSLYRNATGGAFGPLKLEVTIAPLSAAADGRFNTETEITVEPSSTIVVPPL
jgi:hypothetical protein